MKKYLYHGTSTLSFTYDGKDYLVFGPGPHSLPEEAEQVKSAVGLSLLVEQIKSIPTTQTQKNNDNGK